VKYLSGVITQTLLANPRPELGLMYQPGMGQSSPSFQFWQFACDNGRFAKPDEWNAGDWLEWLAGLRRYRHNCLFAVAPDVVGDAAATLELSVPYLPTIRQLGYRAAYVAQDGFFDTALPDLASFDVLFVGGRDDWKFSEAGGYAAARWARAASKPTHMGRVNSERRTVTMMVSLFDSVDGTYLKYGPDVNWSKLNGWLDKVRDQRFMDAA
jgi:hypothetical protein